jgi:hypothetical protein
MTERSPDSREVVVQNRRLIGAGVGRRAAAVIVDLVVMSPALFLVARGLRPLDDGCDAGG